MSAPIQALRTALQKTFKEREDIIDGILVAILSRENIFLLGPAGTAKSALINAISHAFSGTFFSWLMGKMSTPEDIFGPVSLKALTEGRMERVTAHKLPEADFAFLDELFKGNSAILNSMLTAINERTFHNGGAKPMAIPLQTVMAASNEIPTAEELAPFYDRFALRFVTDRLQSDDNFLSMLNDGIDLSQIPTASMKVLVAEQAKAAALKIDQKILELIAQIRAEVHQQGIYVSDRKYAQSLKLIRSFAYLNGHGKVEASDLQILSHVLWADPEQRKVIRRLVLQICNPLGEKISTIMDAVREVPELMSKTDDKAITKVALEANSNLKKALSQLKDLGDENKNPELKQAINETLLISTRVVELMTGVRKTYRK